MLRLGGCESTAVKFEMSDGRRGRIISTMRTVNERRIVVQKRKPFAVFVGEGSVKKP